MIYCFLLQELNPFCEEMMSVLQPKKYVRINLTYACFALFLLSLLNLLNYADRNVFNALIDPIKSQLKFSDFQMGSLASAFLWVYALAAYPLARLADRGNRKIILVIGVLIWSVATFFTGFSRTYPQFFVSRGILGIGEASYATTLAPILSDYFPGSLRSTALSVANAPLGLGTALGYFIGGHFAEGHRWPHAFFYLGIPGIIFGLLALLLREPQMGLGDRTKITPERAPESHILKLSETRSVLKRLFPIKTLRYLIGSSILQTFSLGGMLVWSASLLHRSYGFTLETAATQAAFAATIGSFLGVCFGGIISDWYNRKFPTAPIWVVILGNAFSGISLLLFFHFRDHTIVLSCLGAVTFFQMAINGPLLAAMMNVTVPQLRSTCNAIYLFLIHVLGDAPSPTLVGLLSRKLGSLKAALFFVPWITFLAAAVAVGALFYYEKEKHQMLEKIA